MSKRHRNDVNLSARHTISRLGVDTEAVKGRPAGRPAESAMIKYFLAEFDQLYSERKAFVLAMHPQIIGRPSRITLLERLIRHIQQHEDIQFYRCDQLALELKDSL